MQAGLRPVQSAVVANARQSRNPKARLLRIQLPRMDVDRSRKSVALGRCDSGFEKLVRQQPQIRSPTGRQRHAQSGKGCWRKLYELTGRALDRMRSPRRAGITIPRTSNWKQTGVVDVALLEQRIECPLAARD